MIRILSAAFAVAAIHLPMAAFAQADIKLTSDGKVPGRPFVVLQEQLDNLQDRTLTLEDKVASLTRRVDSLESKVTANQNAIFILQDRTDALELVLAQSIADINAEILALQEQNIELRALIDLNIGDIELLRLEVDVNAMLINDLLRLVRAVESGFMTADQALQAQIDENTDLIGRLQGEIDSITALLAAKQNIIDGTCAPGSSIRQINADGSVVCEIDDSGSSLISSVLVSKAGPNVGPGDFQEVVVDCPSGYTVTGGGFHMHDSRTQNSHQSGNGWLASTRNNGESSDILVFATCIRLR